MTRKRMAKVGGYVVGGTRWLPTLEDAMKVAQQIFDSTGVIVAIEHSKSNLPGWRIGPKWSYDFTDRYGHWHGTGQTVRGSR